MLVRFSAFVLGSLVSLTYSLPAPPPAPSPSQAPPPPINSILQCTPTPARKSYIPPPSFRNCAFALRSLSSFQDMGTFHAGDSADGFQLPVTQAYGSCTVIVELTGGHQTETGSWMEVGLAASELNMACVDTDDNPSRMGGWTTTGRANGVVITVRETMMNGNWTMTSR